MYLEPCLEERVRIGAWKWPPVECIRDKLSMQLLETKSASGNLAHLFELALDVFGPPGHVAIVGTVRFCDSVSGSRA
jgi:hypothetical protein